MPLLDRVRLLVEWAPLLSQLQAIGVAVGPHDRAVAVVKALQWAAGKTGTEVDDEALEHIEAVLKTAEGRAAFDWAIKKVSASL
jgi:hypothetical protein